MRCGEDATDCALRHVVPRLRGECTKSRTVAGRQVPYEWRATCPVCGVADKLTLTAKGRSLLRHCQRCKASQERLTAALAKMLPGCFSGIGAARKAAEPVINRPTALRLAKRGLSGTALAVAMLTEVGMSAAEVRAELEIPKSTYYEAMKALGSKSGFPDSVAGQR